MLVLSAGTHWDSKCSTRVKKQSKRQTSDPLLKKPEETPCIQETPSITQKHTRRSENKFRLTDETPRRTKNVAFSSPEEFQSTNKRRKQKKK
jgi:hypothetical protein